VTGDAGLLGEALSNLLHNAVRYTPRGGHVTVSVRQDGAWVILEVLDDGPGIPADELARAGQRFFRGSNVSQPGTGLGLAIVHAIALRHGGQLLLGPGQSGRGLSAALHLPGCESPASI
jgi:two-component system sensor histidine kinase TctE